MTERKHSHYYRRCPYPHIDVYRVLELFEVTDPALQHIVKKALCAGQRGAKDFRKDLEEIVDTGNRRIEMLDEDVEERLRSEGRLK
jgi:cyanate lyase